MATQEEAHERSRTLWDEMAQGWENKHDYMARVTGPVARAMVEAIPIPPGATILDLACGPGDVGFLALEAAGSKARLIATDFAPEMVAVAKRQEERQGLSNVEYRVMDAQNMDLADDSIDAILCRWGFMLMLDPRAALSECRRVLRAGGGLSFSVWGPPEKNPWVTTTGMVMIQEGHPPQGDPFGPGGMFSMADEGTIRSMVTEAGFTNVEITEVRVTWSFESFDEIWAFVTEVAGAIAAVIKDLPQEKVESVRRALEEAEEPFRDGDGYAIPGVTINVAAS